MTAEAFIALLSECSGVEPTKDPAGLQEAISIEPNQLLQVMNFLRHDKRTQFEVLMSQTGRHAGEEIILYYHLHSYALKHTLCIVTAVPLSDPSIDSVAGIWETANWLERETYDLLGVQFRGHPDLRRIMLPENWEGHPLRKDYVTPQTYGSIDNSPMTMPKIR